MITCYSFASSSFNSIFGRKKLSHNKYAFKVTSFSKKENIFLGKIVTKKRLWTIIYILYYIISSHIVLDIDYDSRNEKGFEFDKYIKRYIKRHNDLIMDELCVLGSNKE